MCGEWIAEEFDLGFPYILEGELQVHHADEEWKKERGEGDGEEDRGSESEEDDVLFLLLIEVLG